MLNYLFDGEPAKKVLQQRPGFLKDRPIPIRYGLIPEIYQATVGISTTLLALSSRRVSNGITVDSLDLKREF
jgi:hypothetical protein